MFVGSGAMYGVPSPVTWMVAWRPGFATSFTFERNGPTRSWKRKPFRIGPQQPGQKDDAGAVALRKSTRSGKLWRRTAMHSSYPVVVSGSPKSLATVDSAPSFHSQSTPFPAGGKDSSFRLRWVPGPASLQSGRRPKPQPGGGTQVKHGPQSGGGP